ncbi:hypothetical protein [Xanthocytophaga agilis]|uniref:Uncharacterized protein n=1 Tax=Xanthocytophaga agilis TaxID=3048010 RepID=A0AAE3QY65_9BACT|nr:hypothetical protein [Xanthocytophaga agilis]MDJ1500261.1 hypothetical protein [Xanthocytophaga agilis]
MSHPIEVILEHLKQHPEIVVERSGDSIRVLPKSEKGFTVILSAQPDSLFIVYFEMWHSEFDRWEDAFQCFMWGLSNQCRLKVTKRGDTPYKWTAESSYTGTWEFVSATGVLNFAFWKTQNEYYLQNDWVRMTPKS